MINVAISVPRWLRKNRLYHFSHPSKWSEVNEKQMIAYAKLVSGQISESKMLRAFLSAPARTVRLLDHYHRYSLSNCLTFLTEDEPIAHFIVQDLRGRKAPEPGLRDVSFAEFIHMDTYFMNCTAGHASDLNNFIACIYARHQKGKRVEFVEDFDSKWTNDLKAFERHSVLKNYGMVRMWLQNTYTEVFQTKEKDMPTGTAKVSTNGWIDVFDRIVGDDYANSDKYAQRPAIEILRRINNRIKEQKKAERKRIKKK